MFRAGVIVVDCRYEFNIDNMYKRRLIVNKIR